MPQAIVKPEELRKFCSHLKQFETNLKEMSAKMNSHARQLATTWRDQEHQKFAEEFAQAMQPLQKLMESTEKYSQFLARKAEAAEKYLQQR
ncbi:WXG100 family type VII secretion target [Candidatus Uabimicrobium sp. HlEnr_7]|uniref:WXG100 family type VII secretion target n=1 Tax=Candidatus Uabimicrobium helgolandensis TaxID=3095367 RepID=UPI00355913E6